MSLKHIILAAAIVLYPTMAAAQSGDGVVMAAYGGGNGETWRQAVGGPFQEATGIPVTIADLPNTEAAVRASPDSPQYNMAWVGYFQAINLYRDGLIQTFDMSEFPELQNVDPRFILTNEDGELLGVPIQFQYYGIAFNTDKASAADFPSWTSLADEKWEGQLAQPQAFVAASYDLVMLAKIAGGGEDNVEPGLPNFRKYAENALTVMSSFAQGNTLLTRGEITATPFYSTRIKLLRKEDAPVDMVIPEEGAIMIPYMLVVPKNAKNPEAYKEFLRYATNPDVQLEMYDYAGYIPQNGRAELSEEDVAELGMSLSALKDRLYMPDYWALADNMEGNVQIVEDIQSGN